jgi:HlyD family secretion protein
VIRRRWPLWLLAAAAAAAVAFFAVPRARGVDAVAVRSGPLAQTVVATGRVATPARIEVSSQLAARIEQVLVREGDRVKAGQLLVQLRSDEAQAALANARTALAEAQGRQAQVASVQRRVAEQQLVQASAALKLAEQELQRARELHAKGFVSQARIDDAERTLASASAGKLAAQAQAEAAREGGVDVQVARTRVEQARAGIASAQARLELLALRAPADAVVLTRLAEPGDTAQVGRAVLQLAQAGETRVIATVDEKNLRHLRIGQAATVVADAYPGQRFDATLNYVAPSVDPQRATVEVRLAVPNPPPFARPEMTVSVEMIVGRREQALLLPAEAVRGADGDAPHVLAIRDGRAERVPVMLGLRGVGTVEAASGVRDGDLVILPSTQVQPGDRVSPRHAQAPKGNMQPVPGLTN